MSAPSKSRPRKGTAAAVRKPPKQAAPDITEVDQAILDGEAAMVELEAAGDDSPIGPDGEIRPVEIGKAGRVGVEQVHVFTLDGTKFFVPKHIPPAKMMKFQMDLRRMDRDTAVQNLMVNLLGRKAIDALSMSDDVSEDDMARVFIIVGKLAFDTLKRLREAQDPS